MIKKKVKVNELFNYMYEFMPLYHQTMGSIYRKDYDVEPKLNKNQQRAIFIIKKHNRISPTVLGRCLDMQKGSLTSLVDSLEKYGFVERTDDPGDRRRQWIHITPKGEEYIAVLIGKFKKEFFVLFNNISVEDIEKSLCSFEFIKNILENIKMTGE